MAIRMIAVNAFRMSDGPGSIRVPVTHADVDDLPPRSATIATGPARGPSAIRTMHQCEAPGTIDNTCACIRSSAMSLAWTG